MSSHSHLGIAPSITSDSCVAGEAAVKTGKKGEETKDDKQSFQSNVSEKKSGPVSSPLVATYRESIEHDPSKIDCIGQLKANLDQLESMHKYFGYLLNEVGSIVRRKG